MRMNFRVMLSLILVCFYTSVQGQDLVDRIIAIVGEEIILQSDVENQFNFLQINGKKDDGNMRCEVMDQLIVSKLLLDKAKQDSIVVSDEQVDSEVERRIRYTVGQMGSEEEFVKLYGKSIPQFRLDIWEDIQKELLIDQMQQTLVSGHSITPREVKQFFKGMNVDSVGFLPAEMQLNHIVIVPPFDEDSKNEAKKALKDIRQEILDEGKEFGFMAIDHSDGPSGPRGGSLGDVYRGQMVPEFEEIIFSMREGDVSDVFETEFGFHIAKVHKIKGQVIECSHILKVPKRSANADSVAMDSLRKILQFVANDSLTFEQAAIRFSQDRATKDCGGCISDPRSGELRIPLDQLDSDLYFKVEEMKEGEISAPLELSMPDGSNSFHVIYVKKKVPPHRPNLENDYKKIQKAALQYKQAEKFEEWLESAKKNIYIDIKPNVCSNALKSWIE